MSNIKDVIDIIDEASNFENCKKFRTFENLIEMTYQFLCTKTYSKDFCHLKNYHQKFMDSLFLEIKERKYQDIFNEIYFEFNFFDKKKAQCQTPQDLSNSIVKFFGNEKINKKGTYKICDFTCGTGVLILSKLNAVLKNKVENQKFLILINDLDNLSVKCCLIQIIFNLILNDPSEVKNFEILAFNNDVILEYNKNGKLIYSNDNSKIDDEYVKRYISYQKEKTILNKINENLNAA